MDLCRADQLFLGDTLCEMLMCKAVQVIEFFRHTYPNTLTFVREVDEWRAYLGRFGISGRLQV
jgi:hypothetical protein